MKHIFLFTLLLVIQDSSFAQNLFFIGESSFSCTETFTLESNSNTIEYDLDVLFAKERGNGLIVVSTEIMGGSVRIKGKIIIYLDDGNVITCVDRNKFDFVDNVATTVYNLTNEELTKLKSSNVNTIRFTLGSYTGGMSSEEGNYSASNKVPEYSYPKKEKTDVPSLIRALFN